MSVCCPAVLPGLQGLLVLSLTSNEVVTSPPESISSDVPDVMKDFVAK